MAVVVGANSTALSAGPVAAAPKGGGVLAVAAAAAAKPAACTAIVPVDRDPFERFVQLRRAERRRIEEEQELQREVALRKKLPNCRRPQKPVLPALAQEPGGGSAASGAPAPRGGPRARAAPQERRASLCESLDRGIDASRQQQQERERSAQASAAQVLRSCLDAAGAVRGGCVPELMKFADQQRGKPERLAVLRALERSASEAQRLSRFQELGGIALVRRWLADASAADSTEVEVQCACLRLLRLLQVPAALAREQGMHELCARLADGLSQAAPLALALLTMWQPPAAPAVVLHRPTLTGAPPANVRQQAPLARAANSYAPADAHVPVGSVAAPKAAASAAAGDFLRRQRSSVDVESLGLLLPPSSPQAADALAPPRLTPQAARQLQRQERAVEATLEEIDLLGELLRDASDGGRVADVPPPGDLAGLLVAAEEAAALAACARPQPAADAPDAAAAAASEEPRAPAALVPAAAPAAAAAPAGPSAAAAPEPPAAAPAAAAEPLGSPAVAPATAAAAVPSASAARAGPPPAAEAGPTVEEVVLGAAALVEAAAADLGLPHPSGAAAQVVAEAAEAASAPFGAALAAAAGERPAAAEARAGEQGEDEEDGFEVVGCREGEVEIARSPARGHPAWDGYCPVLLGAEGAEENARLAGDAHLPSPEVDTPRSPESPGSPGSPGSPSSPRSPVSTWGAVRVGQR